MDEQTYEILGAAMEVHNVLGVGFLEAVYQQAFAEELNFRQIPYEREVKLPVHYKEKELECYYQADFVCYGDILVELKAMSKLSGKEEAQVLNYLRAAKRNRAMLINFGNGRLEYKRLVQKYGHIPRGETGNEGKIEEKEIDPQMNADK
jgi:GxxExxY protein